MFNNYPDVLTVLQVAEALRIGRDAAYSLIHSNRLKCILIGRTIRVPKCCLIDFVQSVRNDVVL